MRSGTHPARPTWRSVACLLAVLCAIVAAGCEAASGPTKPSDLPPGNTPSTPAPPSAPAAERHSLDGVVQSEAGTVLSSTVEIVAGPDAGTSVTTGDDGRYQFEALQEGEVALRASSDGFEPKTATVMLDADKTVDLVLEERLTPAPQRVSLSGVVSAAAGAGPDVPITAADVAVVSGPNSGRRATTDEAGRYVLDDLERGATALQIAATGYLPRTVSIALDDDRVVDVQLEPEPGAPEPTCFTDVMLSNVLDGQPLPGITPIFDGIEGDPSDAAGRVTVGAASPSSALRTVVFSGPGVVTREASMRVPDAPMELSLIPASFDLVALDQMARDPSLRRWTSAPPLTIERRAVAFAGVDAGEATAIADVMSDGERDSLVADFEWALPQLTGSAFGGFGGVRDQTASDGAMVRLLQPGRITVVRAQGLTDATGYWGWSRWVVEPGGAVVGGLILIDLDFDRSGSEFARALRAHELGHALGYAHVTVRPSVMNPAGRIEPNAFDADATRIIFSRRPGSRSPDVDPEAGAGVRGGGPLQWSPPMP